MDNTTLKDGFLGQKFIALPKSIINFLKNNKISENFYISELGYYPKADHHYRLRRKGANQYIFIYCTKGKGEIQLNGVRTQIFPNQFFILPKGIKHEYKADEVDPWSIYWFHFDGELVPYIYNKHLEIKNKSIPFTIEKIELFEKLYHLFDNNNIENQLEYANLLSLNFISSFIYHNVVTSNETLDTDTLVNSIKKFLLNNLNKNFSLDDIAKKFNYSKSYLHTKFKIKTGYSVINFFNLKKTQKACEYLNYTDLSIKEISFKVGFDDPLYFSRTFKNYMGKSPRNYKQSLRK